MVNWWGEVWCCITLVLCDSPSRLIFSSNRFVVIAYDFDVLNLVALLLPMLLVGKAGVDQRVTKIAGPACSMRRRKQKRKPHPMSIHAYSSNIPLVASYERGIIRKGPLKHEILLSTPNQSIPAKDAPCFFVLFLRPNRVMSCHAVGRQGSGSEPWGCSKGCRERPRRPTSPPTSSHTMP